MTTNIETQALAQEWAEDPDGMSEERREALLGAVRERMDEAAAELRSKDGFERFEPSLPAFLVLAVANTFRLSLNDAGRLCEEAGPVAPAQGGPKDS